METRTIRVEQVGRVRRVTLARPDRRNAMTPAMQDELTAALQEANAGGDGPGACRAVVLAGEGESFCAGLDLDELRATGAKDESAHVADARRIATLFRVLYEMTVPTIALVQGAAVAGGAGLATICDVTIASPEARIGYTEVRIGFVPALVSAYLMLQVGEKRARDLLLSGRLMGAEEARSWGLVQEIVAREEIDRRGLELAEVMAENSPQAIAATKRLLVEQQRAWLDGATDAAMRANAAARTTRDFAEGVTAFLEKRRPGWRA